MAGYALPEDRLEALALPSHSLIIDSEASLTGVLAHCLADLCPFASNDLRLVEEIPGAEPMVFSDFAIVPLAISGRLIGAILADNIYTHAAVRPEDLRRLIALANLAAVAIDRARLHAQTVALAEVDGLTGVYNRRYYERELKRLLDRARRNRQAASIVIFDFDFFKGYNDHHGHQVGDQILKEVAQILVQNVRRTDLVARYGGEEFVVLLPDTQPAAAAQVAEKLRQTVKATALVAGASSG